MSLAGKLVYQIYHRPLAAIRYSIRHGGPLAQRAIAQGEEQMRAASRTLPPLPERSGQPVTVHFLSGKKYLHQTAFCLRSLAQHCPVPVAAEIHDDGSIDDETRRWLSGFSPYIRVHRQTEALERLEQYLPGSRFPVLRERWINYPHIRKIIDIHLGQKGWRLVLDSDMLFWREPRFLLNWLGTPEHPLHGIDCEENYGYPRTLLEPLAGVPIPSMINVGLCGLRSDGIDWEFLEHASANLIQSAGTSYYLEQALVALMVARHGHSSAAPPKDYQTLPGLPEIEHPTAVMHHYVDTSRGPYLRKAWRTFA